MKKLNHISEIVDLYDCFIIDLWGVMHNGIKLHKDAMQVVENLQKYKKRFIFLSNAPRPKNDVIRFLKNLNMDEKYLKNVLTSGEAAIKFLKKEKFGKKFYHLGPDRDQSLFVFNKKKQTTIENCDFILCTGLFDEYEDDLNFYKSLLSRYISKTFICTNPDLIVHRGKNKEFCAGTIAEIFKNLGGKVTYFGKPYEEIYKIFLKKNEKSLVIGDNLRTDIKGANNLGLDSILILNGVHQNELGVENELSNLLIKYNVKTKFYQQNLKW